MSDLIQNHAFLASSYAIASLACLYAAARNTQAADKDARDFSSGRYFWFTLSAALCLLAIAKLTGLQAFVGGQVRELARDDNLYDLRHPYQRAGNVAICIAAVAVFASGYLLWGKSSAWLAVPLGAAVILVAFVSVRALSLHEVDTLMYRRHLLGTQFGALIEFTLTTLVVITALVAGVLAKRASSTRA